MAIGTTYDTSTGNAFLSKKQRYELTRAELMLERSSFDAHWQEIASYCKPRRTRFQIGDKNPGDKRNGSILDSTQIFAARTLASGLHAGLTSPARPWMRLTTADPGLSDSHAVKAWLHLVTQRMLTMYLRSNLYNALPIVYSDMGVFGTAAVAILEDEKDMMRAYTYPLGSYAVGLDARGIVNTFVRDYRLTVRQTVEQFGVVRGTNRIDWSNISMATKNLWDRSSYESPVDITWIVTPNHDYNPRALFAKDAMPFASCWFEQGDEQKFLRESGFRHFPVLVPRWDVTGEDSYGTGCPGMDSLPDIKSLQVMQRRKAQAIDKALNPPLIGPSSLRTQKTSLLPGDITYDDSGARGVNQGLRPIHEVRLEGVQHIAVDIHETQRRISRSFYEDLFLMLAQSDRPGQPVTAREIEERHEEKLLALGPVLERTNDELLDPLVDRTFAMMEEAGAIPEPPPELEGVDLRVEYISLMSQAQKLVGVVGQDRFLQSTLALVDAFPQVRHKIDIFQVIDDYGDMLGVNPSIVVPTKDALAAAQGEAQAAHSAQQAEQLKTDATAAQALSKTPTTGDNLLRALLASEAA